VKVLTIVAALVVACGTPASNPPAQASPTGQVVELTWASYQLNVEPRFRLIFEGGTDTVRPSELRIVMPSGASVASAAFVASAGDPLQLCGAGAGKGSNPPPGPMRSTVSAAEQLFKDFIRQPADFRVEAKVADTWRPTRLTLLCHATQ